MSRPKQSNELPATISLNSLRWLLGDVTTEYCNQLERRGVLEKVSRGTYATRSVRSYIRAMRERTLGPQAWNAARTLLAQERALAAKQARLEREGRLLPRDMVEVILSNNNRIVRDNFLALGARLAPRLHAARSVPAVQATLDERVREILTAVADTAEPEIMRRIGEEAARRMGRRPIEVDHEQEEG